MLHSNAGQAHWISLAGSSVDVIVISRLQSPKINPKEKRGYIRNNQ
uniref:Uncharacterized protein n=1 Tax=Anguilla anguilla TaxID=7936 RepID=A0A0E9WLG9_ANGAN